MGRLGVGECVQGASPSLCVGAYKAFVHLRPLTCTHLIAPLSLTRISCPSCALALSPSPPFVITEIITKSAVPPPVQANILSCLSLSFVFVFLLSLWTRCASTRVRLSLCPEKSWGFYGGFGGGGFSGKNILTERNDKVKVAARFTVNIPYN